ncbi:MAG TPA: TadE family protein [Candidatus Sulfotelmatobacter sp.]|jgi:Flp pilus assembly protein TadG
MSIRSPRIFASSKRKPGKRETQKTLQDEVGAQLVEFAVALPLLVLFVVGIFDFSNAFTFKQKLTNIARDAARIAAADPAGDVRTAATPPPASVIDAFATVDGYLLANNINDCAPALSSTVGLTWTYTGTSNGCPSGGLTIVINRGYYFIPGTSTQTANATCTQVQAVGGTQTAIVSTCVSISYAYQWRFGKVASILGSTMALPMAVTVSSVAMNEN